MKSSLDESTFGTIKIGIAQNYIDNTNGNVEKYRKRNGKIFFSIIVVVTLS